MQWASLVSYEALHICVSKNYLVTNDRNFYKDLDVIFYNIIILVYTTFTQVIFTVTERKLFKKVQVVAKIQLPSVSVQLRFLLFNKKSTCQSSCVWQALNWTSLCMWVWSSRLHYSCRSLQQGYQMPHLPYTTSYLSLNKGYSFETFSFRHLW